MSHFSSDRLTAVVVVSSSRLPIEYCHRARPADVVSASSRTRPKESPATEAIARIAESATACITRKNVATLSVSRPPSISAMVRPPSAGTATARASRQPTDSRTIAPHRTARLTWAKMIAFSPISGQLAAVIRASLRGSYHRRLGQSERGDQQGHYDIGRLHRPIMRRAAGRGHRRSDAGGHPVAIHPFWGWLFFSACPAKMASCGTVYGESAEGRARAPPGLSPMHAGAGRRSAGDRPPSVR